MNIEGNEVVFTHKNMAITKSKGSFLVYEKIRTKPDDYGTCFQYWSEIDKFGILDDAIEYVTSK